MLGHLSADGLLAATQPTTVQAVLYPKVPWVKKLDLLPMTPHAKFQRARLFIHTYGFSQFGAVFFNVRINLHIPVEEAVQQAIARATPALRQAFIYWVRAACFAKYGELVSEPSFKRELSNLVAEWPPELPESRNHICTVLRLGNFPEIA